MKSPFCITLLLFLQLVDLSWAPPWDPPTCPLPVPPAPPAQRFLPSKVDGDGTVDRTGFVPTKMLDLLLPRQTGACKTTTCNALYYCCNSETCSYDSGLATWKCLFPRSTVTVTSTYRRTTTSTSTTTQTITTTTSDTTTVWTEYSSSGTLTTTIVVTSTITSFTTTTAPLTRRSMPTPTRCVQRSPEEEKRRGLAKRQDQMVYVTITTTVTQTPASTSYWTTTWLWTEWITDYSTTTLTSYNGIDGTTTETSTTTTTTTATITTIPPPDNKAKIGGGVGGGVGGLALIALVAFLIWRRRSKPTAEEQWAGNQPVEDRSVPPGNKGPGGAIIGAGGMIPATGADDKDYQGQYKGYYAEAGDTALPQTSSPPPPPPPAAYFPTYEQPAQYPSGYTELDPNLINTVPRRPIPGSPEPPSYQGSAGAAGGNWGGM